MHDGRAPIEAISAVTLVTRDMAEAVVFYGALGFGLLSGGPDAEFTSFRAGSGYLNVQLDVDAFAPATVWGRVVVYVDDVGAMFRRALDAGLSPLTSPADAPWDERYFHLRDPFGHELSFARPLHPS